MSRPPVHRPGPDPDPGPQLPRLPDPGERVPRPHHERLERTLSGDEPVEPHDGDLPAPQPMR